MSVYIEEQILVLSFDEGSLDLYPKLIKALGKESVDFWFFCITGNLRDVAHMVERHDINGYSTLIPKGVVDF